MNVDELKQDLFAALDAFDELNAVCELDHVRNGIDSCGDVLVSMSKEQQWCDAIERLRALRLKHPKSGADQILPLNPYQLVLVTSQMSGYELKLVDHFREVIRSGVAYEFGQLKSVWKVDIDSLPDDRRKRLRQLFLYAKDTCA